MEETVVKIYITKLNGMHAQSTEQFVQHGTADIAHSLGIREMGIYRYNAADESLEHRNRRLDGIIAGIAAGDFVICQFPTLNGLEFDRALVRHIRAYHGHVIIFVREMEPGIIEERQSVWSEMAGLYNEAEALIVPSDAMKQFLIRQGIRGSMRFIVQEMLDVTLNPYRSEQNGLKRGIHYAGDPGSSGFPDTWDHEVPLYVYSDQACPGGNVQKKGWMPSDRLCLELSKGGFGLVWYGGKNGYQYLTMNNSLKLSLYLTAGIPVIVPRGISNQRLIEENHLGVVVDTLDEAAELIKQISEQEYLKYVAAVERFAPLLREGFFTKKCLMDAMQMALREDMHLYYESQETFVMPAGFFEYVCVNESYEHHLAISWTFRGEAEGFLVCDADTGKVAGEGSGGLEHYLLLQNDPKESRFIVKAYVRAVRGKMILAESGVAELAQKRPVQPEVSLIMPAYNAQDYIARSIDTALAQSFADMELIIVNDGSTDQTQQILEWYRERFPQVKVFHKENGGQASARNMGVRHSAGEYIALMDNDDTLRPDMIERLHASILKNDCDIAMTSVYQITNEGYEGISEYPMEENTPVSFDEFFELYIGYAYPVIWNKLYRASLVKDHPFAVVTYEDNAWTPVVLSYAEKICYINEHLYEYDRKIRSTTAIHTSISRPEEKQLKDRREYLMFFLTQGNPEKRNQLKRLALGYTLGYLDVFSHPGFKELRSEIEQM